MHHNCFKGPTWRSRRFAFVPALTTGPTFIGSSKNYTKGLLRITNCSTKEVFPAEGSLNQQPRNEKGSHSHKIPKAYRTQIHVQRLETINAWLWGICIYSEYNPLKISHLFYSVHFWKYCVHLWIVPSIHLVRLMISQNTDKQNAH